MNKLEQEIEEELNERFTGGSFTENVRRIQFQEGAQFILDKNLAVQFAEWLLNKNDLDSLLSKSPEDHYDYWINNVYGL